MASLEQGAKKRPNFIFLFTGDQPQDGLGLAGIRDIKPPYLDALATRNASFNYAFVATSKRSMPSDHSVNCRSKKIP